VTDADGRCLQVNTAFRELLGAADDLRLDGMPWDAVALPGERLLDDRAASDARTCGAAPPYERILVCVDGRRIPVLVGVVAIVPGESSLLWFVIDLSTRARLEKERAERALLDIIFESAPVGFGVFDSDLRFLRLNRRLAEINGLSPGEQLGRRIPEVLPQLGPEVQDAFAHVFRTGEAIERAEVRGRTPASDESRTWEASFYPVRTGDGPLFGVASIVHDVTEQRRAEAERAALLRDAERGRAEAESVSRAKDEFLAVLSHELRGPLQGLLGWIRLLQDGRLDTAQQARAHQAIERSARLQTQLVNDLLDASRIVTGTFTLDSQPLELAHVVGRVVGQFRPLAVERGITLESDVSDCGVTLGDPERLQQGLGNLLSNALKFTPPGGTIAVRCEKHGEEVTVTVSDTGEGIGPEFLPHVFDRFRQADGSRSRRHGGLGLGLAIARQLVEMHGGAITAESPGPGRGSTFVIRLPVRPPDEAGAAAVRTGAAPPGPR
jgi:PAS domain S-box-containing protein